MQERRNILRESQYTAVVSLFNYDNYKMELYDWYSKIMWIYFVHIFILIFLLYLFREKIEVTLSEYFSIYKNTLNSYTT